MFEFSPAHSGDLALIDDARLAAVLAEFEADLAGEVAAAGGFGQVPTDPGGGEYPAEETERHGVDPALLGAVDEPSRVEHLAATAAAMPPGVELTSLLVLLTGLPAGSLSASARVDVLVAAERLSRWAAALPMRTLVDHVGPVDLPDRAPADWSGVEQRGRLAEVAVACEASENQVRDRLALARVLVGATCGRAARLAATGAALARGEVSLRHAQVLAETTQTLSDDAVAAVQDAVLGQAAGRDPSRFRQRCRRAVVRVDPGAAAARHELARRERHVAWWPDPDGMARLQVYGPAPEVMAIHGAVDLLAGPRAAGEERCVGARRFDALLELCLAAVAPAPDHTPASDGGGPGARPEATADRDATASGPTPGPVRLGEVRPRCGTKPEVQAHLVVDLPTLLGLADHPAELVGYGPIPAGPARDWLAEATTWRRLVTDPVSGHLLDYGPVVRLAPPRLRDFVLARDGTCTFPGCGRRARGPGIEVDHHPPWRADGAGGSASAAQTGALCAHHHHLKTHGGWQVLARDHGTTRWRSPAERELTTSPEPVLRTWVGATTVAGSASSGAA